MAVYADLPTVKHILGITDDAEDARLDDLNAAISRQLEVEAGLAAGEAFGVASADVTRTMLPVQWTDTLVLPIPIRAATTIDEGGVTFVEGTDVALVYRRGSVWTALYRMGDPFGGSAVNRNSPYDLPLSWYGPITITGQWLDQGQSPLDPVITEAATILVAETFKFDAASPAGQIGPDGSFVPTRNPWRHPTVVGLLNTWRTDWGTALVT